jgi:hypothetical protein
MRSTGYEELGHMSASRWEFGAWSGQDTQELIIPYTSKNTAFNWKRFTSMMGSPLMFGASATFS